MAGVPGWKQNSNIQSTWGHFVSCGSAWNSPLREYSSTAVKQTQMLTAPSLGLHCLLTGVLDDKAVSLFFCFVSAYPFQSVFCCLSQSGLSGSLTSPLSATIDLWLLGLTPKNEEINSQIMISTSGLRQAGAPMFGKIAAEVPTWIKTW